jgi:hypothetical protein
MHVKDHPCGGVEGQQRRAKQQAGQPGRRPVDRELHVGHRDEEGDEEDEHKLVQARDVTDVQDGRRRQRKAQTGVASKADQRCQGVHCSLDTTSGQGTCSAQVNGVEGRQLDSFLQNHTHG